MNETDALVERLRAAIQEVRRQAGALTDLYWIDEALGAYIDADDLGLNDIDGYFAFAVVDDQEAKS